MAFSKEQLIARARAEYEECEKIITMVSGALKKSVDPEFENTTAMICFDIIVQSCLLNGAVQDGQLEPAEIEFIKSITKYANLLPFVNAEMTKQDPKWPSLGWNDIATLDSDVQQSIALISAAVVVDYADMFTKIFATVDKILKDTDLLSLINERVYAMFIALSGIDGDELKDDIAKKETVRSVIIYNALVADKWKEITGE